jgi:ribonuclease P/MRP protein subunit RPP40
LPECVSCECKLYADDSRLISVVKDGLDWLQDDINSVTSWTKDWLMRLNASKYKVMHLGNKNTNKPYVIEEVDTGLIRPLDETVCERDHGIYIRSDLKWVEQVNYAANKANKVLGMLRKTFISRKKDLWKKLYTTLVRPHLEFAVPVWNPQTAGDIEKIEKVQKWTARIPMEFRNLTYEDRLEKWELTKLSERRQGGFNSVRCIRF